MIAQLLSELLSARSNRTPRPEISWPGRVEMGGSRTPRPNSGRSRYATGVSGALVTRRDPSPARSRGASPLFLGSA